MDFHFEHGLVFLLFSLCTRAVNDSRENQGKIVHDVVSQSLLAINSRRRVLCFSHSLTFFGGVKGTLAGNEHAA